MTHGERATFLGGAARALQGHCGVVVASLALALVATGCGARSELEAPRAERCAGEVTIEVPTTVPWFDTGVDLTAGERLRISAIGIVRYGGNPKQVTTADGGDFTGQELFDTAVYPKTIIVSLIGKVGGTVAVDTGTPLPEGVSGKGAGFVGTLYDEVAPVSGRLFLGFNDQRQAFGDNVGAFTVTIEPGC